jgi:hypothetical protein
MWKKKTKYKNVGEKMHQQWVTISINCRIVLKWKQLGRL